jgi:hypothetical protein
MARTSIHTPWKAGPVYGTRTEGDPYRLAQMIRDRCHRNAVHLFKTQRWVIDVGRLKDVSPTMRRFEIDGFTKPIANERSEMPERFSIEVTLRLFPSLNVELDTTARVPDVVLRCLKSTFNEHDLWNEAQLARLRR